MKLTEPRLYHELHITVAEGASFEAFRTLANQHDWRASRFSEDDVDDYHGKWFMSARSSHSVDTIERLRSMVTTLKEYNFDVLRFKAEDTLLDSKHGDTL